MSVAILLPTLNEGKSIGEMIDRITSVSADFRIYIVDSGSVDETVKVGKEKNVEIIHVKEKGKGRAIKVAFEKINEDELVMLDSDITYNPEEIPKMLEALKKCDVVVGSRFRGKMEDGAMSSLNRFGNKRLTDIANILYGKHISDVCSGFWAFKKSAYKQMVIDAPHFELEANFFSECAKRKLKLCEIPINYGKRRGETKLNVFHGFKIGFYLAKKRVLQ